MKRRTFIVATLAALALAFAAAASADPSTPAPAPAATTTTQPAPPSIGDKVQGAVERVKASVGH